MDRLADSVADILVAGAVNRFPHRTVDLTVAGFIDRLADVICAGAVACLINRFAYRVALVTVACFEDIPCACHRNSFCALIVHSLHAGILLLFPDDLLNGSILRRTSTRRCGEIARAGTSASRAVLETAQTAQSGHHKTTVQQYGNCSSGSQHEPFHCLKPRLIERETWRRERDLT